MWRFAVLIAGASAVRTVNENVLTSQRMVETQREDGSNLNADQYVLTWFDPFGSIAMAPSMAKGWEFVVPVICRDSGVWVKVNKIMGQLQGHHCFLVTCEAAGGITVVALDDCPKGTFSHDVWEKEKPDRLLENSDAMVALNGYVFKAPRMGAPPQKGSKGSLMDLRNERNTSMGWEFDMSKFPASVTPKFTNWADRSPDCRDTLQAWSSYGVVPHDESSLAECKLKRDEEVLKCSADWDAKIGKQTAWQWKAYGEPKASDMKEVKKAFPHCTAWCEKENCYVSPEPVYVTRDEDAFLTLFNSKKRDCEIELDNYAEKHRRRCENKGLFCFTSWSELQPCAMTYALPKDPKSA